MAGRYEQNARCVRLFNFEQALSTESQRPLVLDVVLFNRAKLVP